MRKSAPAARLRNTTKCDMEELTPKAETIETNLATSTLI